MLPKLIRNIFLIYLEYKELKNTQDVIIYWELNAYNHNLRFSPCVNMQIAIWLSQIVLRHNNFNQY